MHTHLFTSRPRTPRPPMSEPMKIAFIGGFFAILAALIPMYCAPKPADQPKVKDTPCTQQITHRANTTHKAHKAKRDKTPTVRHDTK